MAPSDPGSANESPTDIVARDASAERSARIVGIWSGGCVFADLPARGELVLGRAESAEIRIDHASVSRKHARLILDGPTILIEDLGSANGTWVDGTRIPANVKVAVGAASLLEIGTAAITIQQGALRAPSAAKGALASASGEMLRVYEFIDVVARSKLSVIILGETGVGKEVLAARVHAQSPRARGAFLKVNCAALVESLLEAELFGYERGAFTGATQAKAGIVEAASGGTLFFDEVGEMPLLTQAKLLRVLESGETTRVGGVSPRKVDVRVVAATNRNLRELVAAGQFRQDLFFRLDGASIHVPPLRAREGEIEPLARQFAAEACDDAGRPPVVLTDKAIARLKAHDWPGNIRELRNVIARSVLFAGPSLGAEDVRIEAVAGPPSSPRAGSSKEEERRQIIEALERSAGNQTRAAKLLGISLRTLVSRLDALQLPRPRKRT
jgi:transcriptional regulator with PAS, ATPase and Fis domain